MIKLIIIDDEAIIRESLSRFIDWESIGVEVCDTAANGVSAMASILNHKPDIILTDIHMAGLDGLELIRLLREQGVTSEVIFISAYTHFEYARKALTLGAFDYVTKPVNEEELLNTVNRCKKQIEEKEKKQSILANYSNDSDKKQQQLFTRLLTSNVGLSQEDMTTLEGTPFCQSHSQAVVAGFWPVSEQSPVISPELMTEFFDKNIRSPFMLLHPFSDSTLVIFFSKQEHSEGLYQDILTALSSDFFRKKELIITLSLQHKWEQKLTDFYTEAALTYATQKEAKRSGIYTFKDTFYSAVPALSKEEFTPKYFSAPLAQEQINSMLLDFLSFFIADSSIYDLEYLKLECIHLVDSWIEHLRSYYLHNYLQQEILSAQKTISSQNYIDHVYEKLYHLFWNISGSLQEISSPSSKQLIRNSLSYIHENFGTPFTLTDVAEHLYVSPTYLSKIFSMEMGQPFSKYLLNYRIQKAIDYMKDSENKLYTIASICGFSDITYFSRAFKTVTGMSPQKYRNLNL